MTSPPPIRLYSYWRSSASYRVRIALALKGLDYEYHAVHLLRGGGEQHQAGYKAVNPQARVPALEVDAQVITQSMAILEFLDETWPQPALMPAGAHARARVRSLAQLIACDIQPLQNIAVTKYLKDPLGLGDEAVTQWLHEWIGRGLAALEARLAGNAATGPFCHGDAPTLADVCLVPQCYAATRVGVEVARYPTITRIHDTCRELVGFRQAAPEAQPDAGT